MMKVLYVGLSLLVVLVFATVVIEQRAFASPAADMAACLNDLVDTLNSCQSQCEGVPQSQQQTCMTNCSSNGENVFGDCTTSVFNEIQKPQIDFCANARRLYSQCYATTFQSCGGLEGPGCQEALATCEMNSGIGQCQ